MTFIKPDERIIIMDFHGTPTIPPNLLTLDELKALRSVGIQTVYCQGAIRWDSCQPNAESEFDFSEMDAYMERAKAAGLKVMIPFINFPPSWKPDDWFLRRDGEKVPEYRSPQALADYLELAHMLVDRYDGDDFQMTYGMSAEGEFPVHYHAYSSRLRVPDTGEILPTEALTHWMIAVLEVIAASHQEIWTAFHHFTKPVWFPEVHDALRAVFPDHAWYSFQFSYFDPIKRRPRIIQSLKWARDTWGIQYFVGSEYCQGLREHTPIVKEHGVRGFITAPLHIYQPHQRLEPWMLDELSWALKELQM